jgi:type IV secretory system conjugative DNA transfer VirD4/TraG family protein
MLNRILRFVRDKDVVTDQHQVGHDIWPLSEIITAWSNQRSDAWTLEDACRGTVILGANGSGKSSGPANHIAERFLTSGFGGLVLCAKADEAETWRELGARTGRLNSMLFFGSDPQWKLNFLSYEAAREGGGLTENIVNLFIRVAEVIDQKNGMTASQEYWQRAMKQLVRNAIDLLLIARGNVSLLEIVQIINSAPQSETQTTDKTWQDKSPCYTYLLEAEKVTLGDPSKQNAFQITGNFWLSEFPQLAPQTRSSIVSTFTTLADALLRDPFRNLFCTETTFVPEMILKGAICIVDLDIKRFGEVGQYAQVLLKYLVQQAVERRADLGRADARPIFIWADECQNFTVSYDQIFQTTARSSRCATVYITQNIPNLYAELGGESAGKSRVDSLLGNLVTKILCQQGDPVTNQWASDMVGKTKQLLVNYGNSQSSGFGSPSQNTSSGLSEAVDYDCPSRNFQLLATGGSRYNFRVEAVIYGGGRLWSNHKTWMKVTFNQSP